MRRICQPCSTACARRGWLRNERDPEARDGSRGRGSELRSDRDGLKPNVDDGRQDLFRARNGMAALERTPVLPGATPVGSLSALSRPYRSALGTGGLRRKGHTGVTEAPSAAPDGIVWIGAAALSRKHAPDVARGSDGRAKYQPQEVVHSVSTRIDWTASHKGRVMERTLRRILTAVTAAAALLISAFTHCAAAQSDQQPTHAELVQHWAEAGIDAQLKGMKTSLRLTADQEKDWGSFESAVKDAQKARLTPCKRSKAVALPRWIA